MENLEFSEKYGYVLDTQTKNIKPIHLYEYQKKILIELGKNQNLLIQHSRQMGLTTLITFHIANFLINNKDIKNEILIKTSKVDASKSIINKVRIILDKYGVRYLTNKATNIMLDNGNQVKMCYSGFEVNDKTNTVIIDDSAYIKDLEKFLTIIKNVKTKMVLLSAKPAIENYFNDILFKENEKDFNKIKIKWGDNPKFTKEWYKKTKKSFGYSMLKHFYSEIELLDVENNKTNKNTLISFRIDDEMMGKLSNKLLINDVSLSEYLRNLIKKDLL